MKLRAGKITLDMAQLPAPPPARHRAIVDALLSAFDLADFDRLLASIGKRREVISTANGLRRIVADVVAEAERGGWLGELLDMAKKERPSHDGLRRVVGYSARTGGRLIKSATS